MSADTARRVLLACLHEDAGRLDDLDLATVGDASWDAFLHLAAEQRVRPLALQRLRQRARPGSVPELVGQTLQTACRDIARRQLHMHAELAAIARALGAEDIPVIVLKGAYIGPEVYGSSALREMNDVDILVPREHLHRAVEVVRDRGYEGTRRFSVDLDVAVSQHVTRLMRPGHGVELHWNVTAPGLSYSIDPRGLWERAVALRTGPANVFALSPEDLLLHLCLHTSYQHRFEFGLRPFCDIAATIRRFGELMDWDAVDRRCAEWRWGRGVRLALWLARDLVGAAVPDARVTAPAAAPPSAAIVDTARAQVFTNRSELRDMGEEFGRLGGRGALWPKVRHLYRRVFVPRAQLGAIYVVDAGSPTLALFYLTRLLSLLRRFRGMATRLLWKGEPALVRMAERKSRLADWLTEA